MGMNWNVEPAPYRENTIRSFQQAAAAGASFVEFDVQVRNAPAPPFSIFFFDTAGLGLNRLRVTLLFVSCCILVVSFVPSACLLALGTRCHSAALRLLCNHACQCLLSRRFERHASCSTNELRTEMLFSFLTPVAWTDSPNCAFLALPYAMFAPQVTRDGVPVVWHDDDIVFGRPGSPQAVKIADVAAEEFCLLGQLAASRSALLPGVLRRFWDARTQQQHESHSAWHSHDDDGFPTLEDVFKNVPVRQMAGVLIYWRVATAFSCFVALSHPG